MVSKALSAELDENPIVGKESTPSSNSHMLHYYLVMNKTQLFHTEICCVIE